MSLLKPPSSPEAEVLFCSVFSSVEISFSWSTRWVKSMCACNGEVKPCPAVISLASWPVFEEHFFFWCLSLPALCFHLHRHSFSITRLPLNGCDDPSAPCVRELTEMSACLFSELQLADDTGFSTFKRLHCPELSSPEPSRGVFLLGF